MTETRTMEFFNSKFTGFGVGGAGDCRVVIRTNRKNGKKFVQILDDSDNVGLGFEIREVQPLIDALINALQIAEAK